MALLDFNDFGDFCIKSGQCRCTGTAHGDLYKGHVFAQQ